LWWIWIAIHLLERDQSIFSFFHFHMFHVFIPTEDFCENRYLQTSIPKYEMTGSCDFVQSVGIEISEWK